MQVITSCNSTQEELCQEFCSSTQQSLAEAASTSLLETSPERLQSIQQACLFQYVDHVRSYPKFKFAGVEGTKVCTVAFRKLQ